MRQRKGRVETDLRDWSLITGRGGYKTGGGGGQVKLYPPKKRGVKSFSHAEERGAKSFGVVFMQ